MKTINSIKVALLAIAPAILVGGIKISTAGESFSVPENSVTMITAQAPNSPVPTITINVPPVVSPCNDKTVATTGHNKVINLPASNGIMQTVTIWIPDAATCPTATLK
jgi:hypothetical protein